MMKRSVYRYAALVVSLTCTVAAHGQQAASEMQALRHIRETISSPIALQQPSKLLFSHTGILSSRNEANLQKISWLSLRQRNALAGPGHFTSVDTISRIIPGGLPFQSAYRAKKTGRLSSLECMGAMPYSLPQPQPDSLPADVVKRRVKIVAATNIVSYSAGMVALYHAWYKDYPQSKFHFFNDIGEWKGIDKIGHAYSAYAESKASMELWRWTGIERKKRIWLGGMSGAFYQTVIEVLDGFSAEWGWSWADFGANIAGSGLLVAQELAWDEQRIQFKWSFHRKHYADATLNARSNDLFGSSSAERFLKDYNGQTYWLSTGVRTIFPGAAVPAWLQVSIGTGAEGLFGGYDNIGEDENGNISFSRPDIARRRQWYLAPDVDLTKIPTNKKGIRLALRMLNIVKFPSPSLEYSAGKFSWNWLHF